jgi:hypothetical protein
MLPLSLQPDIDFSSVMFCTYDIHLLHNINEMGVITFLAYTLRGNHLNDTSCNESIDFASTTSWISTYIFLSIRVIVTHSGF